MNKTFALLAALAVGMPAAAADRIVQGVDLDAVPWATFCPSVKAVALHGRGDLCGLAPGIEKARRLERLRHGDKAAPAELQARRA